jgi:dTDP-L-rhamnose 4-epimerase
MALILITGGAGFIGHQVSTVLLASGHKVRILDSLSPQIHGPVPSGLDWLQRSSVDFIRGSVTERGDLAKALTGVDTVIHLAAETGTGQSMYEIARYCDVNSGGTALLMDILANDSTRTVKRILLASSRSIYGEGAYSCPHCQTGQRVYPDGRTAPQLEAHRWDHDCPDCKGPLDPIPTHENDPAKPASIYAATKLAQEDLVRIGCVSLGMDYAILRLQNVYGEGQSLKNPYTGILSIFSTRIRRRQHLPIFEDGMETRDFVHVDDVANAFVAAAQSAMPVNMVINVGTGIKTTIADIAATLSMAFGVDPDLVMTNEYRLGDIRHNYADTKRLQAVLGYKPKVSISEGMQRFAKWVNLQPLPDDGLDKANAELKARKLMN